MKSNRRGFLKALGLGAAVTPVLDSKGEWAPERIEVPAEPVGMAPQWEPQPRGESVSHWLYSGVTISRGQMQESYNLFVNPFGHSGFVGLAQTNVFMAGRLPMPQCFAVEGLGLMFSPATLPALRSQFAQRYSFTFVLGEKLYFDSPVAGLFSVGEIDGGANPELPVRGVVKLDIPVLIPPECYFHVTLQGDPIRGAGKLQLWAFLTGRLWRSIC